MHSNIEETRLVAVYIVGPSSTGKTTLCSALALKLGLGKSSYITEVARTVMRNRGFTREDVGTLEMQKAIMEAQLAEEEKKRVTAQAAQAGRRVLLSDRSAIDAIVYAILTSQNRTEADERWKILTGSAKFQTALPQYQKSTFFLLTPIPEWLVDDGIRSLDDQYQCLKVFKQVLLELGIGYKEMGATTKELSDRVDAVLRFIQDPSPRL